MDLAIVGAGRLGRSVARILDARVRAGAMNFTLVSRGEPIPRARVTYLAVADRDIEDVAALVPQGSIVLHASGVRDFSVLRDHHKSVGSLHPLMTFPGPEVGLPQGDIPATVDGSDQSAIDAAERLAKALGFTAVRINGDRRLYHAAAVIAEILPRRCSSKLAKFSLQLV